LSCTTATTGASFGHAHLYAGALRLLLLLLLASDRLSEQRREQQCGRGSGGERVGAVV
jgi:hypothetical protein